MNNKNLKIGKGFFKTIFTILIIIIIIGIMIVSFIVWKTMSSLNYVSIDKTDLSINTDLYKSLPDSISESEFNKVKTILLLGSDSRNETSDVGARADSIMLLSVNPQHKSIKLISIPRDTYVSIPGYGKDKINHAYAFGKEKLMIETINKNFNLNVTEYAIIDFFGIIQIINDLNGIEVEITEQERKYINDTSDETYALSGNKKKNVEKSGLVKLDGEQALMHSRNRTIGDDFTRARRQRDVLTSLINKISKSNIVETWNISDNLFSKVKTNIEITRYIQTLGSLVVNYKEYTSNVISVQIPDKGYSAGKMINGVYYFTTDYNKAKQDMIDYIYMK